MEFPRTHRSGRRDLPARLSPLLLSLSVLASLLIPTLDPPASFHAVRPGRAAAVTVGAVQVGTSFSPRHATHLGLDRRVSYRRLEAMHFKVIRVSAYWDEIDAVGYDGLDWLMAESKATGQPVLLSVGMKGLGWPEFYIPPAITPKVADGGDVGQDPILRARVLEFITATVDRYRQSPILVGWQVENEPLNPAGPNRWFVGRDLLALEVAAVKAADRRPVVVNAFGHFNMLFDRTSNRSGFDLRSILGFESATAEGQSLSLLGKGDILGLDLYTEIGYRFLGRSGVSRAGSDWAAKAGHWRSLAAKAGKAAWITEAQAEPWEASVDTYADPRSTVAADIAGRFASIQAQGFSTILLWGAEYWLWRADAGDPAWLDQVTRILAANAGAADLRAGP